MTLIALSEIKMAPALTVELRPGGLALYGRCGYTKRHPYFIERGRCRTAEDALHWMGHLMGKKWSRGCGYELARALSELLTMEAN